ncbi:hypothetical protein C8R44DRAFT_729599 [Mycena epipterygia]|nr:hypothetical protein C8R44DRAFT_729599 [Mycena epipterygia]
MYLFLPLTREFRKNLIIEEKWKIWSRTVIRMTFRWGYILRLGGRKVGGAGQFSDDPSGASTQKMAEAKNKRKRTRREQDIIRKEIRDSEGSGVPDNPHGRTGCFARVPPLICGKKLKVERLTIGVASSGYVVEAYAQRGPIDCGGMTHDVGVAVEYGGGRRDKLGGNQKGNENRATGLTSL